MCYHLKTEFGGTEAVIDDNCGISKFYSVARTLADELEIQFMNQVDDADILSWDFHYKKHVLTLQYSIFNGISILPPAAKNAGTADSAVREIAQLLVNRAY